MPTIGADMPTHNRPVAAGYSEFELSEAIEYHACEYHDLADRNRDKGNLLAAKYLTDRGNALMQAAALLRY